MLKSLRISKIILTFAIQKQTNTNFLKLKTMSKNVSFSAFENGTSSATIVVNGVKMLLSDYRKQLNANKPKVKKVKKVKSDIALLQEEVQGMVKKLRLIKSLNAYYDHAYKQWGLIGQHIIEYPTIKKAFIAYRQKLRDINATMQVIEQASKRSEKAVFAYFEKLSWQLDDIRQCIDDLCTATSKSGLLERYKNHECIIGQDKRLGLRVLMGRTWTACKELNILIKRLQDIREDGLDPFAYTENTYIKFVDSCTKAY